MNFCCKQNTEYYVDLAGTNIHQIGQISRNGQRNVLETYGSAAADSGLN